MSERVLPTLPGPEAPEEDAHGPGAFGPVGRVGAWRWSGADGARPCDDDVVAEVPVALEYNGIAHTVMLASPADLEDFACGFSLTEGIIARPRDIRDIERIDTATGVEMRLTIAAERFSALKGHRRSLAGRTGCGLCGAESLSQVVRDLPPVAAPVRLTPAALQRGLAELAERQPVQRRTGAAHAAAWIDASGAVIALREDVGRHNALDKLAGALARGGVDCGAGAVLVTSRASYEMVQKTAAMGAGLLAAISAPTTLAVDLAARLNLTLVGFLRGGSHMVYTHPWRLQPE